MSRKRLGIRTGSSFAGIQLPSGSPYNRRSGFIGPSRGSGNFYLDRRELRAVWITHSSGVRGRLLVFRRLARRKLLTPLITELGFDL